MAPNAPPSVSVSRRGQGGVDSDPLRTIVWVSGEHDVATRVHLSVTIAEAAVLDDADIVVDLAGVTFMDASTIGALLVARNRLRSRSRSLSVRAPSARARRVLDLCGLERLIDENPAPGQPSAATALGSWVAVPSLDRGPDCAEPPVIREAPSQEPASARATERRGAEPAAVQQRPASS